MMLDIVASVIKKHKMINKSETVVVGVSGGSDSIALLHILKRLSSDLSFTLVAAHLNHMLRGADAEKDEQLVKITCQNWGVNCISNKTDVRELADKWRISEEEAGRKARYVFFQQLIKDIKANKLALAHHKDDRVETVFHNIVRGTGMQGLIGINYIRDGFVIRPLLDISKEEILNYCKEENLSFREDESNSNLNYTRNRLRHVLVPFIRENFNPNIVKTVLRMSDLIKDEDEFLEKYCEELLPIIVSFKKGKAHVVLDRFMTLHLALKRRLLRMVIYRVLGEISRVEHFHIEFIINMFQNAKQGAVFKLPGKGKVTKTYGFGIIADFTNELTIKSFEYDLNVPGCKFIKEANVKISAVLKEKNEIIYGTNPIHIDADNLYGGLVIRSRRFGDRFKPLGMSCEKKLKEFFIDLKVPREERGLIPLITDSRKIIWVAGYQINEDYKISDRTTRVIELKILPATYEIGEKSQ